MIFKLLSKELKLAVHPNFYIFTLLGVLVIVPNYPYGMIFIFGCLAPFISFMYARETGDIYFSSLLPIKRSDIVKAKCLTIFLAQLTQIMISLPFAFLNALLIKDKNLAGIEANVAFYGFGLIAFSIFNLIFLTQYFKTAHKVGKSFILAIIPSAFIIGIMEVIVHFEKFAFIDSTAKKDQISQLPLLLIGIVLYFLSAHITYLISKTNFKKVDL